MSTSAFRVIKTWKRPGLCNKQPGFGPGDKLSAEAPHCPQSQILQVYTTLPDDHSIKTGEVHEVAV